MILTSAGFAAGGAVFSLAGRDPARLAVARRASVVALAAVVAAMVLLWVALFQRDFSIQFVANQTTTTTPFLYTFTALWGGLSGSLLLWCAVLAGYGVAVARAGADGDPQQGRIVLAIVLSVAAFFTAVSGLAANPFAPAQVALAEGRGMNPLLHSWGMAIHPVLLYLGWTGTTVVFGWAVAGLVTRRPWIRRARRWALFSWLSLGLGLVVGGAWAYTELGWGGVWAWDPVENAPLLSWLALTALIHSAQVEERQGALRVWNAALACLAFLTAILGTFLVRSGTVLSIHDFGFSPVAWWFLALLGVVLAGSAALIAWRSADLRSQVRIEGLASRETIFLLNNLLLVTALVTIVLVDMAVPALSEAILGYRLVMGPPFFNFAVTPILALLVVVSAVGVAAPWRRNDPGWLVASIWRPALVALGATVAAVAYTRSALFLAALYGVSFVVALHLMAMWRDLRQAGGSRPRSFAPVWLRLARRNRRKYGGYLVHVGMALVLLGFAGSIMKVQEQLELEPGQSTTFAGKTITFDGMGTAALADRDVLLASLRVSGGLWGERTIRPNVQIHPGWDTQPRGRPGILPEPAGDLYVFLRTHQPDGSATFQAHWNPLVGWIWVGALVATAGGLLALGRNRRREAAGVGPSFEAEESVDEGHAAGQTVVGAEHGPEPEGRSWR